MARDGSVLVEAIERAASTGASLRFEPSGHSIDLQELWRAAIAKASAISSLAGDDGTVAMVLRPTISSISCLLAAWHAGLHVVSLPPWPGGAAGRADRIELLETLGTTVVIVDGEIDEPPPDLLVRTVRSMDVGATGRALRRRTEGSLIQFTSGTTGPPQALRVPTTAILQNAEALLEVIEPRPGDVSCSWLPLYHDMGLVGMLICGLLSVGPQHANGGGLVLIDTEAFARGPRIWMRSCSALRATITTGPPSGYGMAAHFLARESALDLSRLRVCVVGAEPILPDALDAFSAAAGQHGFDDRAFCPAYGLAEATLGVTMVDPATRWHCTVPKADASPDDGPVVSCGLPLRSVGVHVDAPNGETGPIWISTPSLADERISVSGSEPLRTPYLTSDEGFVVDGELYVTGRADDAMFVGGRTVQPHLLEDTVSDLPDVRSGRVAAVAVGEQIYVVFEPSRRSVDVDAARVRISAVTTSVLGRRPVVLVAPAGSLPRTSSGKLSRASVRNAIRVGRISGPWLTPMPDGPVRGIHEA